MPGVEERLIELEIRYTHQHELLETLNEEMVKANRTIDVLTKKIRELDGTMRQMMDAQPLPPNEKPPHY